MALQDVFAHSYAKSQKLNTKWQMLKYYDSY